MLKSRASIFCVRWKCLAKDCILAKQETFFSNIFGEDLFFLCCFTQKMGVTEHPQWASDHRQNLGQLRSQWIPSPVVLQRWGKDTCRDLTARWWWQCPALEKETLLREGEILGQNRGPKFNGKICLEAGMSQQNHGIIEVGSELQAHPVQPSIWSTESHQ